MLFTVKQRRFHFLKILMFMLSVIILMSACGGGETTSSDGSGQDNDSNASTEEQTNNGELDDKDEFVNKEIYDVPLFEELLKQFQTLTYTVNGHENHYEFLGEEEVDGVMTEHFYLKVADDLDEGEYEIWMNDDDFAEKAVNLETGRDDYDADSAHSWLSNLFTPFYEFNREFRYVYDFDELTITSHETHNDALLSHDVIVHTIKGDEMYYLDGD